MIEFTGQLVKYPKRKRSEFFSISFLTWNASPFHLMSQSSGRNEMDSLSRKMQYALVELGGTNSPLAKMRGRQNTTVNTQVQAITVLEEEEEEEEVLLCKGKKLLIVRTYKNMDSVMSIFCNRAKCENAVHCSFGMKIAFNLE